MPQEHEICCFWGGGKLTYLEVLSLKSFVAAGHPVTLYAYDPPGAPPAGVTVQDAADILPRDAAPDALIADLFRYHCLAKRPGVIWAAPDFVLLKPLRPENDRLLAEQGGGYLTPDILALPPDSKALGAVLEFTAQPRPIPPWATAKEQAALAACDDPVAADGLEWGVWGAKALSHFAGQSGEAEDALPKGAFYPISYADRAILLTRKANIDDVSGASVAAIPLYRGEIARQLQEAEGGLPKYWCPLGSLLRQFEVAPRSAPLHGQKPAVDDRWTESTAPPSAPDQPSASLTTPPPPMTKRLSAPAGKADRAKKVLIVTTMKNEGPFILEWIAYHRSIGVTDFVIYTNDCDDGTDDMHDLLQSKGIVTEHHVNPFGQGSKAKDPQRAALWDAEKQPPAQDADWIIPMDVDEFINIHVGQGQFQDMLDAVPDANMISMVWRLFGNGFQTRYRDAFITENMTWCAHERSNKPHQAWGFKTAFRDIGAYKHFSVHRPQQLYEDVADEIRWYSSAGRRMPDRYKKSGWRVGKPEAGYGLVSLNHYSIRSSESYLVKRQRGRVNHVDRDQGMAYWFRMNHNAQQDFSISNKLPGAKAEFQRLMADEDIAAMHRRCVAAHQARIAELHGHPEYAALFQEIESKRIRNLSRLLFNFGNAIFGEGPDAVPREFVEIAEAMDDPEVADIG